MPSMRKQKHTQSFNAGIYGEGLSVKPIYNIVLKADYTRYTDGGTNGDARLLNLGLGYVF